MALHHLPAAIFGTVRTNPWNPYVQAALRRLLPLRLYRGYVGRHEHGSLRIWRELAARIPANRAILDIGAYRGEYALAAREVNETVPIYAFEPNPISLEVLRGACHGKGIATEGVALSERSGTASFMNDSQRSQISEMGSFTVRTLSLDDWRINEKLEPALLKIDTEGAEAGILRGAQKMIRECRPTLLCEILSDEAGDAVMAILPTYRYLRINEDRGTEERQRITREHWRHKNWLLIPH